MSNKETEQTRVDGTVAPGFESVKSLFEHNMKTQAEENAQLCVYVGEERVVDLWATAPGDSGFSPDSLVNVFSSGKNFEAIAIAWLVSKGLLNYSARITDYWPEFGAKGKGELTVAELMRHEAGLAAFDVSLETKDLLTENIKLNRIGSVIENHSQKFRDGGQSKREYHALTRGWIVNEVFRRVDPKRRTIGEFLREDIRGPFEADVIIGVRKEELNRIKPISPLGIGFHLRESLKPRFLGRRVKDNIFQLSGKLFKLIPALRNGTTAGTPAPFVGMKNIEAFNDEAIVMGETPSGNAHCSARGLAQIAALMANGGNWAGIEFLTGTAWKAMHDDPVQSDMGLHTTFTQGGVAQFHENTPQSSKLDRALNQGREGFYGWMGLGGSIFQWHPKEKIGFGFVPTSLHVLDIVNERGKVYQTEVLECLKGN